MRLSPSIALLPLLLVLFTVSACQKVEVAELYALRLDTPPGDALWEEALPLLMKGGGGNIHGRNERMADLERDTDAVHAESASCHHGPPITDPVFLEARAYYTGEGRGAEMTGGWATATRTASPCSGAASPAPSAARRPAT
jgi:hypothetical protein